LGHPAMNTARGTANNHIFLINSCCMSFTAKGKGGYTLRITQSAVWSITLGFEDISGRSHRIRAGVRTAGGSVNEQCPLKRGKIILAGVGLSESEQDWAGVKETVS
jgi:hypothetical protein